MKPQNAKSALLKKIDRIVPTQADLLASGLERGVYTTSGELQHDVDVLNLRLMLTFRDGVTKAVLAAPIDVDFQFDVPAVIQDIKEHGVGREVFRMHTHDVFTEVVGIMMHAMLDNALAEGKVTFKRLMHSDVSLDMVEWGPEQGALSPLGQKMAPHLQQALFKLQQEKPFTPFYWFFAGLKSISQQSILSQLLGLEQKATTTRKPKSKRKR